VTESRTPIGWVRHLKVKRRHERDDIGWGVLQTIKNELPGPDAFAVEFYPPVIDVMDENNMRHLWGSAEPPPLRLPQELPVDPAPVQKGGTQETVLRVLLGGGLADRSVGDWVGFEPNRTLWLL
jgi:hypothetical protein